MINLRKNIILFISFIFALTLIILILRFTSSPASIAPSPKNLSKRRETYHFIRRQATNIYLNSFVHNKYNYTAFNSKDFTYWRYTLLNSKIKPFKSIEITAYYKDINGQRTILTFPSFDTKELDKNSSIQYFLNKTPVAFCIKKGKEKNKEITYSLIGLIGQKRYLDHYNENEVNILLKKSLVKNIYIKKHNKGNVGNFEIIKIVQVSPLSYYLFTPSYFYVITEDKNTHKLSLIYQDTLKYTLSSSKKNSYLYIDIKFTPKGKYIIYKNAYNLGVIEINTLKQFPIGKSCLKQLPQKKNDLFYNSVIDFTEGPYKTITPFNNIPDTYEQTYCSGGSCAREGIIHLYKDKNNIECKIKIQYKLLYSD